MKHLHRIALLSAISLACVAGVVGTDRGSSITVKGLWIYPFENNTAGFFSNATVIEKTATCVRFKAGEKVYEHCGHYTIEN